MDSYEKKQESWQDDVPEERYGQYHRGGYRGIECADGKNLPYKGYIEVELAI